MPQQTRMVPPLFSVCTDGHSCLRTFLWLWIVICPQPFESTCHRLHNHPSINVTSVFAHSMLVVVARLA